MKPRSFGFWSTFLIRKKTERKRTHFWELIPQWFCSIFTAFFQFWGGPQMLKQPNNQQKFSWKQRKHRCLGMEKTIQFILERDLWPWRIFEDLFLTTHSALFNSNGSSVLLHTLLHLSKVTLTLLIYFSNHTFTVENHYWLPVNCRLLPLPLVVLVQPSHIAVTCTTMLFVCVIETNAWQEVH